MNIKLVYDQTDFNLDVMSDTPCQYLFKVANKIFRIPINQISLFYGNIEIKNNSRLIFSVMDKTDKETIKPEEIIIVKKKSISLQPGNIENQTNNNSLSINRYNTLSRNNIPLKQTTNNDQNILPLIGSQSTERLKINKIKQQKKPTCIMKCQLCNIKNSIFYCRVCNLFICFECNVRYNEHQNHEIINLEDGDTILGCDVYREEILNEINIVELGFQQSSEFIIDNIDRESYLQSLFKSLEQIRNNSQTLADLKTMYDLDQNMINDFREEVDKIPQPKHREEIADIFGNLNLKETELRNYTKFINLQIIKTEYNKVFLQFLDKVKKYFDLLITEVKSRLNDCEDVKNRGIEDIREYLKKIKNNPQTISDENFLFKNKFKQRRRTVYNNNNNNNNNNPVNNLYKNNSNKFTTISTTNEIENIRPNILYNSSSNNNLINNYCSKKDNNLNDIINKKRERKSKSLLDKDFGKSNEKCKKPIKIYNIEGTIKEENNKNKSSMSEGDEYKGNNNISYKNLCNNLSGSKKKDSIISLKSPVLARRKLSNDCSGIKNLQTDRQFEISKKSTVFSKKKINSLNLNSFNNLDKINNPQIKTEEKLNLSEDKNTNKNDNVNSNNNINANNSNEKKNVKKRNSLINLNMAEFGNKNKNEEGEKNDILIRPEKEDAKKRTMRIKNEIGRQVMNRLTPDEKKISFASPKKIIKSSFFLKKSSTSIKVSTGKKKTFV